MFLTNFNKTLYLWFNLNGNSVSERYYDALIHIAIKRNKILASVIVANVKQTNFFLYVFQLILQSAGVGPSVLQQLCALPFPFYGAPGLTSYIFPVLLAATHRNPEATAILSCEMSYQVS